MNIDIVRAWKDRRYRESLSAQEKLSLPANPIGEIELYEQDLAGVFGGLRPVSGTVNCCEQTVSDMAYCCASYVGQCA